MRILVDHAENGLRGQKQEHRVDDGLRADRVGPDHEYHRLAEGLARADEAQHPLAVGRGNEQFDHAVGDGVETLRRVAARVERGTPLGAQHARAPREFRHMLLRRMPEDRQVAEDAFDALQVRARHGLPYGLVNADHLACPPGGELR